MKKAFVQASELRGIKTLDWVPSDRIDLLHRHLTELRIRKGEILYHPGRIAKHLYCVLDGTVGLSLAGSEGRLLRLALVTRGEFFGVSAFVPGWCRVSQAVALRDSRVGRIEARTFVTEVCGLPWDVFTAIIESTLKPLLQVSLRRALFLVENLVDRVALMLWEYAGHPVAEQAMGVLPPALTHEELAALVGASRPRVSLALRELENKGFFTREGNQIRVHGKRLRAYLEDKYGYLF
ncbi:MAG: Crp/Fnr family transcriptional regulator [Deltaproteobacteria bacterium]|nr:Crp/Fnr family transcriptional regulator [Deltaproteobacteria bacterium]